MHRRISEPAALLAIALLNLADDAGRFEADVPLIERTLFGRRPLSKPVVDCLGELVGTGFLVLYGAEMDGERVELGQVVNFRRHQVINRATPSRYAAPSQGVLTDDSVRTQGVLTEDSGTAHASVHAGKEGKGKERKEGSARAREGGSDERNGTDGTQATDLAAVGLKNGTEKPFPEAELPTEAEVVAFGNGPAGIPAAYCRHYHEKKEIANGWIKNARLVNWRMEVVSWFSRDRSEPWRWEKKSGPSQGGSVAQWEAELEAEKDPARRRELREKIAAGG